MAQLRLFTAPMMATCLLAAIAVPGAAQAQDAPEAGSAAESNGGGSRSAGPVQITPYIEASQVLQAQLSPGDDVVTYTQLAVGVDANVQGRNNAASVSIRYERDIAWDSGRSDSDTISGIARASVALVPRTLTLEAGGLATRTRYDSGGTAGIGAFVNDGGGTDIYSGYVGPSLTTHAGDVQVEAHYRLGYSRVEASSDVTIGDEPVDLFDESTTHIAAVRAGIAPDEVLPVGLGVGGTYYREDVSLLDQRVEEKTVRADVTVPVSPTVALVGGIGYEDVEISSRDAVRDPDTDLPIIGPDGRFVTDGSSPREIAYQTNGLIWDVGVMWRPSRRTSLEAHVGRRYDSISYFGSFSWSPSARSNLSINVYDSIAGFGGRLNNALASLPTTFEAFRNPVSGDIVGCVQTVEGDGCLTGALASLRSATFRSRGVAASYSKSFGRLSTGIGAGYDNRKFIAAEGTVLAAANGQIDETIWLGAFANYSLDRRSSLSGNVYANFFQSDVSNVGDLTAIGASASYYRNITGGLSAHAALALDSINYDADTLEDLTVASALVGMRYQF